MMMARRAKPAIDFDRELSDHPPPLRRREFMMRVEAVIFAASRPVAREVLEGLVGRDCNLDLLIEDIRDELRGRPYEIVIAGGGFQYRTRPGYAEVIRSSGTVAAPPVDLSQLEALALTAIAYFQPITRTGISDILGKKVSRDVIGALRAANLVATGPRSPTPGAPYTYVTTQAFLALWGLTSLRDLPDMDRLEEAGLLGRMPLPDELRSALGLADETDDPHDDDGVAAEADAYEDLLSGE
jgi:segregation and condensation protein B